MIATIIKSSNRRIKELDQLIQLLNLLEIHHETEITESQSSIVKYSYRISYCPSELTEKIDKLSSSILKMNVYCKLTKNLR